MNLRQAPKHLKLTVKFIKLEKSLKFTMNFNVKRLRYLRFPQTLDPPCEGHCCENLSATAASSTVVESTTSRNGEMKDTENSGIFNKTIIILVTAFQRIFL
jgi:hypothetical protein